MSGVGWAGARPGARSGWTRRATGFLKGVEWRRLDWTLFGAVAALSVLGTLLVWVATSGKAPSTVAGFLDAEATVFLRRHLSHLLMGLVVCFLVVAVDHRVQRAYAPLVYVATIIGLVLVLTPLGAVVNGSRGWLVVAGFQAQPSELAKVGLVVCVAMLLGEPRDSETAPVSRDVLFSLAALALPLLLVMAQPDLGTALVLVAIFLGMLALSGAPPWWIVGMAVAGATSVAAVWQFDLLEPYQLARVATLIDPTADPQGAGYNANQALIAIGSGGFSGTGLFQGEQTSGRFVPEQHTDFIFTVAGEELGFLGGCGIIVLITVVLWRILRVATSCRHPYTRLVCVGVATWFGCQGFVNIGMALGVLPITGLPLPFVSYGGTATIANMAAVGLVLGIHLREREWD